MQMIADNLSSLNALDAHEITELWVQLTNAASSDVKAKAFLVIFEP